MLEHPPVIEGRSAPLLQKQLTHSEACGWKVELGAEHGILWVGRGPLPGSLGERFIVRTDGPPPSDRLCAAVGTRPLPERGPFHHALPECFSALEQRFVPS